VDHINDFSTSVMYKPSHNGVHLCFEVPIQKTRNIHQSRPQRYLDVKRQDKSGLTTESRLLSRET
jgi:hypothetical protein